MRVRPRPRRGGRRGILARAGLCAALAALALWSAQAQAHGDLQERIDAATAEISRAPGDAQPLLRRAELHRLHEDWAAALADCDSALALEPSLESVDFLRGRILLEAGRAEEALASLGRFLERHPDQAEALLARSLALEAMGDPAGAAADYARVIAQTPQPEPEWVLQRARMLERAGEPLEALAALDAGMAQLGPLVSLQEPAIDLEVRLRRLEPALARLDTLAAQSQRQESWLARRGDILMAFEQSEAARAAYEAALAALEALPPTQRTTPAMKTLEAHVRGRLGGA